MKGIKLAQQDNGWMIEPDGMSYLRQITTDCTENSPSREATTPQYQK
jgi:hypothetical protein